MRKDPVFLVVDLFCGAGGTTTGFDMAEGKAKVIACVNHDPKAIESHWRNHPEVLHFEEDIRTLDLTELVKCAQMYQRWYPDAKLVLWASLECTNFSKAKGGQPRDADSRTLADHLDRYIVALNPDYVQIENVVEFMSWGPLDDNGKPVSRKAGTDWMRWRQEICAHGYRDEWREMNSANYGAYTSRNRLFGVFAKEGLPIAWPEPTHAKNPSKFSMHGDLQRWKAVKEVLDFNDEGESIFTRSKELSDKTLERIYAGLLKYVAQGDTAFISKYYSGKPSGKNIPVEGPAGTVTCVDGQSLVQTKAAYMIQYNGGNPESRAFDLERPARVITTNHSGNQYLVQADFLLKYNSMSETGKHVPPSIDEPAPTVACQPRLGLVRPEFLMNHCQKGYTRDLDQPAPTLLASGSKSPVHLIRPEFLTHYYGSGGQLSSIDSPAPTIPTKARTAIVKPEYFIDKHFGTAQNQSIDAPAGSILPTDKHRLVKCEPFLMPTNYDNAPKSIEEPSPTITANRKHHYLVNPSWGGHPTNTDRPCPVIVARQDKAPLYLVQVETGQVAIAVYESDSEVMIRIKEFMAIYQLVDIKMRMLRVHELLRIQGFPEGYQLLGSQADQKKFIGNSVVPHVVKAWTLAMAARVLTDLETKVA